MKVLKDVELTVVVKDMELLLQIVRRNVRNMQRLKVIDRMNAVVLVVKDMKLVVQRMKQNVLRTEKPQERKQWLWSW